MRISARRIAGFIAGTSALAGAILGVTGCSSHEAKSSMDNMTPAQMNQTMQQNAQNYALYRQSHPAANAGLGGQAAR